MLHQCNVCMGHFALLDVQRRCSRCGPNPWPGGPRYGVDLAVGLAELRGNNHPYMPPCDAPSTVQPLIALSSSNDTPGSSLLSQHVQEGNRALVNSRGRGSVHRSDGSMGGPGKLQRAGSKPSSAIDLCSTTTEGSESASSCQLIEPAAGHDAAGPAEPTPDATPDADAGHLPALHLAGKAAGVGPRDLWTHCPGYLQWVVILQLCMWLQMCVGDLFQAPPNLDHDAGFDGSYAPPPAVVDMAAWVYKIVMLPGNVVPCNFYKNVSNYVIRLFVRLVNDVTFVAQARKPGLDMLRAALEAPLVHPLFRWLVNTIEGFKARAAEWQDEAEVWKWLKEGLYRPMMAVLIMATLGYDFDKAEALWGKTQRDLLHSAFFRVAAELHRTAEWAVGLRGNASPSAPPLQQRGLNGARARALLELSGLKLAISPWFVYRMSPGLPLKPSGPHTAKPAATAGAA